MVVLRSQVVTQLTLRTKLPATGLLLTLVGQGLVDGLHMMLVGTQGVELLSTVWLLTFQLGILVNLAQVVLKSAWPVEPHTTFCFWTRVAQVLALVHELFVLREIIAV